MKYSSLQNRYRALAFVALAFPAAQAFPANIYGPVQALQDFQKANYLAIDQKCDAALAQKDSDPKYFLVDIERALGRPENNTPLRTWLSLNPRSSVAWASLAMLYKTYADNYRAQGDNSSSQYTTMMNSYKTCLDRALLVAPQAAYLYGMEIECLQGFGPAVDQMENYFKQGQALDKDCYWVFAARASYLAHQPNPDWGTIKLFIQDITHKAPGESRLKLLPVYYHELYAHVNPGILSDYLATRENWDDIVAILGDYVWNHSGDVEACSWYARISCDAQKYTEAMKQFKKLDDNGYLYGGWASKDDFIAKRKLAEANH